MVKKLRKMILIQLKLQSLLIMSFLKITLLDTHDRYITELDRSVIKHQSQLSGGRRQYLVLAVLCIWITGRDCHMDNLLVS